MFRIDVRNTIAPLAILQIRDEMKSKPDTGSITVLCEDVSFIEDMKNIMQDYEFTINFMKNHGDHLTVAMFYKQA